MDQEFSNYKDHLLNLSKNELINKKNHLETEILNLNYKVQIIHEVLNSLDKPKNVELGVSSVDTEEVVKFR